MCNTYWVDAKIDIDKQKKGTFSQERIFFNSLLTNQVNTWVINTKYRIERNTEGKGAWSDKKKEGCADS